jgi:hypothetical protein
VHLVDGINFKNRANRILLFYRQVLFSANEAGFAFSKIPVPLPKKSSLSGHTHFDREKQPTSEGDEMPPREDACSPRSVNAPFDAPLIWGCERGDGVLISRRQQRKSSNEKRVLAINADQPSGAAPALLAGLSKSTMPAVSKALALEYAADNIRFCVARRGQYADARQ